MIDRLKRRFSVLAVGALTAAVALMVLGMNLISFGALVREADGTLALMSENRGRFPEPDRGAPGKLPPGMSPEVPYESRYFSVTVSPDGGIMQPETSKIAAVDRDTALEYGKKALDRRAEKGFVGKFRYLKYAEGDNTKILFLDCRRSFDAFTSFFCSGLAVSAVGLGVLYVVVLFFIRRILRPVEESYEKQKRFITDAGHEIKTPLTVINANAALLELELGENECVSDICTQTKRLTALTNDLVELSRMDEGDASREMSLLPLSELTSEAAERFRGPAKAAQRQLFVSVEEGISLRGNGKSLMRMFDILLENALKYSPEKGSISLSLEKRGRTAELRVENDTARPVPEESLSRVFDRFYRADASRNSETGGFGIGLSVAKSVADAHGAKIFAFSDGDHRFGISVRFQI